MIVIYALQTSEAGTNLWKTKDQTEFIQNEVDKQFVIAVQKVPEVEISQHNEVRRQIGRVLSFVKDKQPCLLPQLYQKLPQNVKAIGYTSPEYKQKLSVVNQIMGSCDLIVKERDIIIAKGLLSQANYIFFTNFMYHPLSLCCQQTVILKCIEKEGYEEDEGINGQKWQFMCAECLKILLKLSDHPETQPNKHQNHLRKRKLLDFALHVASGRYKKHKLQQDPATLSYQHVKSRFRKYQPHKGMQSIE